MLLLLSVFLMPNYTSSPSKNEWLKLACIRLQKQSMLAAFPHHLCMSGLRVTCLSSPRKICVVTKHLQACSLVALSLTQGNSQRCSDCPHSSATALTGQILSGSRPPVLPVLKLLTSKTLLPSHKEKGPPQYLSQDQSPNNLELEDWSVTEWFETVSEAFIMKPELSWSL